MQQIVVGIPLGPYVSARWFSAWTALDWPEGTHRMVAMSEGPYVARNMRVIVSQALQVHGWDRLVIVETDMLPPRDALVRHAEHTAPVVAGLYFEHEAPFRPVARIKRGDHWVVPTIGSRELDQGLIPMDRVGMGCTSIRRDVLEALPTAFVSEYSPTNDALGVMDGELSHDYVFCRKVQELGFEIMLDCSMQCEHLTLLPIGLTAYQGFNPAPQLAIV